MTAALRRDAMLAPVLIFVTMVTAIVSALGAPLIPTIAEDLHVSISTAQWSLTAALLSGAIAAPILGRLGDGPHRRRTLAAGLAVVTAGGIVSAVATDLAVLVAGRAMQGVGLGLVPLTMAAARDHLPRERVAPVIALLSVCAAAGVGAGYPLTGLIADGLGLSAAFWFGAVVGGLALAATLAVVPRSSDGHGARLDIAGAALLSLGLVALLLAIAEGGTWSWSSPAVVALLAGAVLLLGAWVFQQLRCSAPLVELRLLRHPSVLTGNAVGLVQGVAMYINISTVIAYVQTPTAAGYGFGASVVVAGLILVPFSIMSLAASRMLPWLAHTIGERAILPLGALTVGTASAFFALLHGGLWEAFVMMAIIGVGLGLSFAAIPGLIVRSVPRRETGSAMGFYQVVRYVGFSLGSALTAAVLAGHTPAGSQLPTENGYGVALWIAVGFCVVAAVLAWVLPERRASRARSRPATAPERIVAE
ncbi:MFS transporter [Capillimicrobium parvum]|uniref:Multidrug resistance protein Stp n=1 Tax=Capillimicrobium parvum TaxID=2884022 RepID=A0A9E6XVJ8_9ACTN|nr:MFS transporter [Capillimicrobium parvum]UGS35255.1 Multidrug resistance protein Stp [Capillimicrobium parvum]